MWHNAILIGSFGVVVSVAAWLLCRWSGYTVAAWVAPLAIGTFCLGLFVAAENTTNGRFKVPLPARHSMHAPRTVPVITELRGALHRMQAHLKAALPSSP